MSLGHPLTSAFSRFWFSLSSRRPCRRSYYWSWKKCRLLFCSSAVSTHKYNYRYQLL